MPYAQDVERLTETLVISFTDDPSTPHTGAIALAAALPAEMPDCSA